MKLLKKTYSVKANLEHVYICFSNLDYILNEINRLKDNDEVKVTKKGKEIIFKRKTRIFSLKELEKIQPSFYKAEVIPIDKKLLRFGKATIECEFSRNGSNTEVYMTVISSKTPGLSGVFLLELYYLSLNFNQEMMKRALSRKLKKAHNK